MTRREKILLALMGVSLAGSGLVFWDPGFLPWSKGLVQSPVQQAQVVAASLSSGLQALPLNSGQRAILAAAQQSAENDPFREPPQVALGGQAGGNASLAPGMSFTGYVQVGKEAIAIIGGLEYAVGDVLPETGDIIRSIRENSVTLYSPVRKTEWELSYSGDDI